MSSFGVKSILGKDIVTGDVWYRNSEEMCQHLSKVQPDRTKGNKTMIYQHIDPVKVDRKRMSRNQIVIHGCMKQHLFDYKPGNAEVFRMEYLCDCTECLKFDFKNCVKTKEDNTHATPTTIFDHETECGLDDEDEYLNCLLYTSPSPRDKRQSRMPSSA